MGVNECVCVCMYVPMCVYILQCVCARVVLCVSVMCARVCQ